MLLSRSTALVVDESRGKQTDVNCPKHLHAVCIPPCVMLQYRQCGLDRTLSCLAQIGTKQARCVRLAKAVRRAGLFLDVDQAHRDSWDFPLFILLDLD